MSKSKPASSAYSKTGNLFKYEDSAAGAGTSGTWGRYFSFLKGHELSFSAGESKDEEAKETIDLEDATVTSPDAGKVARRFAMDITTKAGVLYHLCADNRDEHDAWLQAFAVASVPDAWPGGIDFNKRPHPLLYSMWVIQHTGSAASVGPLFPKGSTEAKEAASGSGAAARAAKAREAGDHKVPSPFPKLPALKSAPSWQRKGLLLQKLRQCSIVFEGVDPGRFGDDWEVKRNTLLEIVDYADVAGRQLFSDFRVLDDTFTMIKLNLFRSLPRAPEPSGDPDEEEESFSDPQWPHLNIVYELLLRLVSMDHIDLALKKKAIDPPFVRQLMLLFDSEDPRERDYLKTITHRIYSKLTQRRALIRRVICNVFFEFIFETESHNGVAEMLEILASIINGFAVPIKDEHKIMLVKALVPLHKAKTIAAYHPQLSYCMALYVAKDHTLTRDIIPGLLRHWPFGTSAKQIMFINELEDIFEYVQEDDVESFRDQLALRLAKCIGGLHFQVSERTLLLWNSERFAALLLESPQHRGHVLRHLFPVLYENQQGHWHESIRTLSGHILEQYGEVDRDTYTALKSEYDAHVAAAEQQAAAMAVQQQLQQQQQSMVNGPPHAGALLQPASPAQQQVVAPSAASASSPQVGAQVPHSGTAAAGGALSPLQSRSSASSGGAGSGAGAPATPVVTSSGAGMAAAAGAAGGGGSVGLRTPVSPLGPGVAGQQHADGGSGSKPTLSPGLGVGVSHTLPLPHRAPAVRASSSFPVSDNADLLPHHRGDPGTPKRDGLGRHGGHGGLPLPMSMPIAGGDGADNGGED